MLTHKRRTAALEAAEWFVRLEGAHLSRPDRDRYLNWLKKSPVHVAEMLRLLRLGEVLRSMTHTARPGSATPARSWRIFGWRWLH